MIHSIAFSITFWLQVLLYFLIYWSFCFIYIFLTLFHIVLHVSTMTDNHKVKKPLPRADATSFLRKWKFQPVTPPLIMYIATEYFFTTRPVATLLNQCYLPAYSVKSLLCESYHHSHFSWIKGLSFCDSTHSLCGSFMPLFLTHTSLCWSLFLLSLLLVTYLATVGRDDRKGVCMVRGYKRDRYIDLTLSVLPLHTTK